MDRVLGTPMRGGRCWPHGHLSFQCGKSNPHCNDNSIATSHNLREEVFAEGIADWTCRPLRLNAKNKGSAFALPSYVLNAQRYLLRVKVAVSGVSAEEGPARMVYSPGILSIASLSTL
jgi:hypothetical protein